MKTPNRHPGSLTRRSFIKTAALAMPFLASGCAHLATGTRTSDAFVTVRNGRFELRGRPHFYIGANMWFGCYLGDAKLPGGRQRLVRELDRLQALGVTNLRLLAGSESHPYVNTLQRGITCAPHDYDAKLLAGLDFTLAEMAKRDMRGILFLSNFWDWSGGFTQYIHWATGRTIPDPEGSGHDWHRFMQNSAEFYRTPAAVALYRDYTKSLIYRRNTINGRLYRDDPTIMTWELANEPRPGADDSTVATDVPIFCDWVDATAQFIHEQDPNHLVCTGSEGIRGCLDSAEAFIAAHKTSAIDYVTAHMWLKNWGWLKEFAPGPAFEAATIKARDHVEQHNQIATDVLKKPLVLEEFGLPRDHEKISPGSPTLARDEYYRRLFDQVFKSCQAGRALQAANFWAWGGEGRQEPGIDATATAFTGDPFPEAQGLNSVFNTDISTLAVIAAANRKLS